ncbi:MAG: serine/threonine protein phosphatase [Pirellulales bacterium]|nr:serine/threonine protein phosphatase [Pirellulales bacterium]
MSGRLIAIGDLHGCFAAFEAVLEKIAPQPDDTLITLGDYVDRGPDSRGVIDLLLQLRRACRLVPLLGNHDEIFVNVCDDPETYMADWLCFGGDATLASYRTKQPTAVPAAHLEFIESCTLLYESERHFFTHGSYDPALPFDEQDPRVLLWGKVRPEPPGPHYSGKIAILGHTAQRDGKILDLGHLKCIDTCCYGAGVLTALEVNTGQVWQADKNGKMK